MKPKAGALDGFVKNPPKGLRAALLFGPDAGLIRERADILARTAVPTLDDPFLVSELTGDGLADDPGRLGEEAAAIAMTGGRRVVLVRDASDKCLKAFENFFEDPLGDGLIVAWGAELPSRSKLRKLFEEADEFAAAIPCYLDDEATISRVIDERFKADNVTLESEARRYLVEHLGSDRALSRAEIEKLALYAGPGGRLTVEDVSSAIGDSAATALDDVVYAAADGDGQALDRAIEQGFALGIHPVPMLRQSAAHIMRLRHMLADVEGGRDPMSVVKGARPPIFFKLQNRIARQLSALNTSSLADAFSILLEAEAACKRTGAPDNLVASRALHQVAALARHSGRRAGGQARR